jgi:hypothetical protein
LTALKESLAGVDGIPPTLWLKVLVRGWV